MTLNLARVQHSWKLKGLEAINCYWKLLHGEDKEGWEYIPIIVDNELEALVGAKHSFKCLKVMQAKEQFQNIWIKV